MSKPPAPSGGGEHQRLIACALRELAAAAEAAQRGRLVRTYAVQLLLAFLYDSSDGDRAPFEAFLRLACGERAAEQPAEERAQAIRAAARAIAVSVSRAPKTGRDTDFARPNRCRTDPYRPLVLA